MTSVTHTTAQRRWSDQDLLDCLRRCSKQLGKPVSLPAFNEWRKQADDRPAPATVVFRFGSWNEALRQAGLPVRQDPLGGSAADLDPELIKWVQRAAEDLGVDGALRRNQYAQWAGSHPNAPSARQLARAAGGWVRLSAQVAGRSPWRRFSDEEALAHVRKCAESQDGKPPSMTQYARWAEQQDGNAPAMVTLRTRFRGWRNVLDKAGLAG
jgi:hypothetical protein